MQKYQKRRSSIIVEACQVNENTVDAIANWAQAQIVEERRADTDESREGLNIKTPGGKVRASDGMYVVKHNGEFHVMTGHDFEVRYDAIIDVKTPEPDKEGRHKDYGIQGIENLITDPFQDMTRFGEGPRP